MALGTVTADALTLTAESALALTFTGLTETSLTLTAYGTPDSLTVTGLTADGLYGLLNTTFETDLSEWSAYGGATVTRTTSEAHSGIASMSVTTTADLTSGAETTTTYAAMASTRFGGHVWHKTPVGVSASISFLQYTAADVFISQLDFGDGGTGAWKQRLFAFTTDASCAKIRLRLSTFLGAPATLYFDDLEAGATLLAVNPTTI